MRVTLPRRFWVEVGLAGLSACLFVLTLVSSDWIEQVFGFDPDHHNGSLEWLLVAALLAVTLSFGALARSHWRRALPAK